MEKHVKLFLWPRGARRVEWAIRYPIEVAWDEGNLDTLQRFFDFGDDVQKMP